MQLLGGSWTPDVIRQLSGGPRRFGELQKDISKISPKVLTSRLRRLEARGAVIRNVKATSPPSVEYELSEIGKELLPVIDAIVKVGTRLRFGRDNRARLIPNCGIREAGVSLSSH